jgi:hypothetical protein
MYSNAQYMKNIITGQIDSIKVEINGLLSVVPIDEQNTDYQNIMALVAAGELTIAPADGGE